MWRYLSSSNLHVEALGLVLLGSEVKTGESWGYSYRRFKRAVWLTGKIVTATSSFFDVTIRRVLITMREMNTTKKKLK